MFWNKNSKEDFEYFRERRAYEQYKQEQIAKRFLKFIVNISLYGTIYIFFVAFIGVFIESLFDLNRLIVMIISSVIAYFLFKIEYIKMHPVKTLFIQMFCIFLLMRKSS